jgi:hypothetical protein
MRKFSVLFRAAAVSIGLAIPTVLFAQQTVLRASASANSDSTSASTSASPLVSAVATQPVSKPPAPLLGRWLELKTLSHSQRYRHSYDSGGFNYFENGQQRSLIEGRVKLDAGANYTIGFRASSGHFFNWAYSDYAGEGFTERIKNTDALVASYTPAEQVERNLAKIADPSDVAIIHDIQSNGWQFYLRELYFSATPVKGLTAEFGSFGIERGVATEITTFDDDGYLSGERIRIRNPKHLFFDQIGYTNAYFGSYGTANLLDRGSDLTKFNYRQVFADKKINSRIDVSGDYTWLNSTDTLRAAALVDVKEVKVVDSLRAEAYVRVNSVNLQGLEVNGGSGFSLMAQKKLGGRLIVEAGFASIDKDNTAESGSRFFHSVGFGLNGDSYSEGKRPILHATYRVNSFTTAFGFYTHQIGTPLVNYAQQGLNGGLTFDMKALANTGRKVF